MQHLPGQGQEDLADEYGDHSYAHPLRLQPSGEPPDHYPAQENADEPSQRASSPVDWRIRPLVPGGHAASMACPPPYRPADSRYGLDFDDGWATSHPNASSLR